MPTDKRARQKAARQAKRAAQARRVKRKKLLRNSGLVIVGAAVVIALVVLTRSHGSSPAAKKPGKSSTTALSTTAAKAAQAAANKEATAAGCPASTSARVNTLSWPSAPALTIDPTKTYSATVKTTAGSFTIALDAKTAPTVVNNFVFLSRQGFYHCVTFHRVITGFVDQTGDPTGTGSGGPGYSFANQNVPGSYATGEVVMANSGGTDTNGSQFFLVAPGGAATLDKDLTAGDKYALFGKVSSGMSVVDKINAEGSARGTPKVVQRVLTVTIHES